MQKDEGILSKIMGSRLLMWVLSIAVAVASKTIMWQIFDNRQNFSELNRLEREAKLFSESGHYYSYYKDVVASPTLLKGIGALLVDGILLAIKRMLSL